MVEPLKFYKWYMGIKAHFNSESYDLIEKKCRTKGATKYNFEKRRDCKLIVYISAKFQTPKQATSFLVANFAYKNEYPFADYEKSVLLYKKWCKNKESLSYNFTQDIKYIKEYCEFKGIDFWDVFYSENELPAIIQMALSNKLNIESLAILCRLQDFTKPLLDKHPMWHKDILRIRKLGTFINVDEGKYNSIIERIRET